MDFPLNIILQHSQCYIQGLYHEHCGPFLWEYITSNKYSLDSSPRHLKIISSPSTTKTHLPSYHPHSHFLGSIILQALQTISVPLPLSTFKHYNTEHSFFLLAQKPTHSYRLTISSFQPFFFEYHFWSLPIMLSPWLNTVSTNPSCSQDRQHYVTIFNQVTVSSCFFRNKMRTEVDFIPRQVLSKNICHHSFVLKIFGRITYIDT